MIETGPASPAHLPISGGLLVMPVLPKGVVSRPGFRGKVSRSSVASGIGRLVGLGWRTAALIGVSMMPRAEIALIVADRGQRLSDWAMPPPLFAGLMVVSLTTALVTPLVLHPMLSRWPQRREVE